MVINNHHSLCQEVCRSAGGPPRAFLPEGGHGSAKKKLFVNFLGICLSMLRKPETGLCCIPFTSLLQRCVCRCVLR